mgnify:FL=1
MVLGEDGTKLSKRNGDASFMDLYNDGYLPEAIVNYLAFLGWSPDSNKEIFSLDELIASFDPRRISKSSSSYDVKKLNWYNAKYIKSMSLDDYMSLVLPFLKDVYDVSDKSDEWIRHLVSIYQNHISYGKQIVDEVKLFFEDNFDISSECNDILLEEDAQKVISTFKKEVSVMDDWSVSSISLAINNTKEKTGVKGKMLYMPIRIKTSGIMHGPELADTIYLIGKEAVLDRLERN